MNNRENNKEKRALIHKKLEIMKKCYRERKTENFDLFYDTFFERNRRPIIIGTDNGAWFHSMGQIHWLISYDWEKWGKLEINSWNFTVHETEKYDMVRTKGVLDFGLELVWDIDIVMIFSKAEDSYICRLMQFKVPRNEIRPVVTIHDDPAEQAKSEKEMNDLMTLNGKVDADPMRDHLAGSIETMLRDQRPYLDDFILRKDMIYVETIEDHYLFAMTGYCWHKEMKALMPFRMVGIGQGYEILDAEFSHPFAFRLG